MATQLMTLGTGRRKESVARVRLQPGTGRIVVNEQPLDGYFKTRALQAAVRLPLVVANAEGRYDVLATVIGGGIVGQAGAVRHGIARALAVGEDTFRPALHKAGLLTRDPRMKERKKYGRKRARKGFQYSKR